jgi:hypothetical protein
MAESDLDRDDVEHAVLARAAAESFAAAHPEDLPAAADPSPRRRALAERLAAGPRPESASTPRASAPPRTTRTIVGPAIAVAIAIAAVAVLLLARPGTSTAPATPRAPADYRIELGGPATELGDAAPDPHRRRGDRMVIRATPARSSPTPHVRARWSGEAVADLDVAPEHQPGGAVILRLTVDREPGRHTLELLIGDDDCAWDRPVIGCEQPSVDVEVDP